MHCPHLSEPLPAISYCFPVQVQGELLGVLNLRSQHAENLDDAKRELAYAVVEQIGMTLSNLNLRAALREQSIREVWKGPMFVWWRAKHAAREGGDIPLCRECPDWQYRSWTHNWEKVMRTAKAHRLRVIEWAEHEKEGDRVSSDSAPTPEPAS